MNAVESRCAERRGVYNAPTRVLQDLIKLCRTHRDRRAIYLRSLEQEVAELRARNAAHEAGVGLSYLLNKHTQTTAIC